VTKSGHAIGKRTTIYDLAKLASSSPTAVSSVLNGSWKSRRISVALAEKITKIADEHGYAVNLQAAGLRKETSNLIGMIVPKYDNRYFGSIVEQFESMARARGLFPIVTCTQRDAELELQAARAMISHQVGWLIATGATDPDRLSELCQAAGVRALNLDLPGTLAPSVISDNRAGAKHLTQRLLSAMAEQGIADAPVLFIGGRASDHNTRERLAGYRAALAEAGKDPDPAQIITFGYAPEKAVKALTELTESGAPPPKAMFVSSTITLEGVLRWVQSSGLYPGQPPQIACFDWDPLAAALNPNIVMQRQDVPKMLEALFGLIDAPAAAPEVIEIATLAGEAP
jgi:LacI family fructose operon transcriptional repressor